MMDFPLVEKNLKYTDVSGLSFHFEFNRQEPLAEALVTGRVRKYLSYFSPSFSHSPNPRAPADRTGLPRLHAPSRP